jgi:hypothetical protein
MTQGYPPGDPYQSYFTPPYATPVPRVSRPTVVTVFAIIGIVWGVGAILCDAIGLFTQSILAHAGTAAAPAPNFNFNTPPTVAWPIWFGLAVLLLIACICALSMVRAAPRLMIIYGIAALVLNIALFVYVVMTFNPANVKWPPPGMVMPAGPGATTMPAFTPQMLTAMAIGGQAFNLFGSSLMPLALLIVFSLPGVRAGYATACAAKSPWDAYGQTTPFPPTDLPPGSDQPRM